jgi:hypothetical protein
MPEVENAASEPTSQPIEGAVPLCRYAVISLFRAISIKFIINSF